MRTSGWWELISARRTTCFTGFDISTTQVLIVMSSSASSLTTLFDVTKGAFDVPKGARRNLGLVGNGDAIRALAISLARSIDSPSFVARTTDASVRTVTPFNAVRRTNERAQPRARTYTCRGRAVALRTVSFA